VGGVADQHHRAVVPVFIDDGREAAPDRAVGNQPVALEFVLEQRLAVRDRGRFVGLGEAGPLERFVGRLHDEGRAGVLAVRMRLVLVGMDAEQAVLVALEVEGESGEGPGGAQPHEAVPALVDVRAEAGRRLGAQKARHSVRGHDEIGLGKFGARTDLDAVPDLHPQAQRLVAQDPQEGRAGDAAESVAGRSQDLAAVVDIDVVPVVKRLLQPVDGDGIGVREVVHGGVREHHAEAEGIARLMPLEQGDGVGRVPLLEQNRQVKGRGPGADPHDSHGRAGFRSWAATNRCWISVAPS
jgi:hypothetical protein